MDDVKQEDAPMSDVTPINPSQPEIPEELQKQVVALRHLAATHNVIAAATHTYANFSQADLAIKFLHKLHGDMLTEVMKAPIAKSIPELAHFFEQKEKQDAHAAELKVESEKLASEAQKELGDGQTKKD